MPTNRQTVPEMALIAGPDGDHLSGNDEPGASVVAVMSPNPTVANTESSITAFIPLIGRVVGALAREHKRLSDCVVPVPFAFT